MRRITGTETSSVQSSQNNNSSILNEIGKSLKTLDSSIKISPQINKAFENSRSGFFTKGPGSEIINMLCIDSQDHKEGDEQHNRNIILLRHVVEIHRHDITLQDILNANKAIQDKFKEYLFAKCDKRKLLSKDYISNGIFAASLPVNSSTSRYAKTFPNYNANIGEFSSDLPQLTSDLVEMPKVESNHRCGDFIILGVITACFITGTLYAYS